MGCHPSALDDQNTSHHSRDFALRGDASGIRSIKPCSRLRSFAYNILKANQTGIPPEDRYRAALAA